MRNFKLKKIFIQDARGFTLVELLVTVAIVGFIMAAVYGVQVANMRAVDLEEDRVEMQQGQRIALDFMARELRMAAYDKTDSLVPSIVDARSDFIYFTLDRNEDGDVADTDEHAAFCLFNSPTDGLALGYVSGTTNAVGNVGSPVAGGPVTSAHANHGHQVFTPIETMEFFYTLADGSTTLNPAAGQMSDIRSVVVTILARADAPDPRWQDTLTYARPSGAAAWGPFNDGFRRRLISASIRFRNMGL